MNYFPTRWSPPDQAAWKKKKKHQQIIDKTNTVDGRAALTNPDPRNCSDFYLRSYFTPHHTTCVSGSGVSCGPSTLAGPCSSQCVASIKFTATDSITAALTAAQPLSGGFPRTPAPRMWELNTQRREFPARLHAGLHVCLVPAQSKQTRKARAVQLPH